jgi:hypothetical protein
MVNIDELNYIIDDLQILNSTRILEEDLTHYLLTPNLLNIIHSLLEVLLMYKSIKKKINISNASFEEVRKLIS